MLSPARRHVQRVLATKAASNGGHSPSLSAYNQMLLKLSEDLRRLKPVQSTQKKAELKREMLPYYEPWVAGVLESGRATQDDVLMHVMIWRIDAGDVMGALDIAQHALKFGIVMPSRYTRTTACAVAEEIADAALADHVMKKPLDLVALQRAYDVTEWHDMPDQVRAKLLKVLAYALRENEQNEMAYKCVFRAFELDKRCGVKKDLAQLEKFAAISQPSAPAHEAARACDSETKRSRKRSPTAIKQKKAGK